MIILFNNHIMKILPLENAAASLIAITPSTKVGLVAIERVDIQSKLCRWCTIAGESKFC
jgi:hypothetical protein